MSGNIQNTDWSVCILIDKYEVLKKYERGD